MIIDWRLYGRTLYGSQWPVSVRIVGVAVAPESPAGRLEYTVPPSRLEYTVPASRLEFTVTQ